MSLFEVHHHPSGAVVVSCPPLMNVKAAEEFQKLVQPWMRKSENIYILDFAKVTALDSSIFRPLVLFFQTLKNRSAFLYTINVTHNIELVIKMNGLENALSLKPSIEEALEAAGVKPPEKSKIDVNFINPFVNATKATFEMQANTPIRIGKPFLKKETDKLTIDIAGVISLTSPAFHGSIALCFPAQVFLAIYSNMLGEKHDSITREIEDAAGEILNIIFGQAKAELNDKAGYQIQKAIPTIVRGSQLEVHHLVRNVAVVLPFETDAGSFHLEVSTEAS